MVVLVTGSSGTVGTALMLELNRSGFKTIGLDIKRSLWDEKLQRRAIIHDLRKPLNKKSLPGKKIDMIVHLAANARVHDSVVDPKLALDNYLMSYNILEFARENNIGRVLFSSSREIYGETKAGKRRSENKTDVTQMKSPYTASKFGTEALISAYSACYGINSVIARLSNVYGKYDVSERVIPLFMYYALRNRNMVIFGKEKKLDFTYIDDCTDGLIRIIKRFDRVAGRTFNICFGKGEKLGTLAKLITGLAGSDGKISYKTRRVGEISSFVGDISLANRLLSFRPKVTLEEGLVKSLSWYKEAMTQKRVYNSQRRNLARRGWA